MRVHLVNPSDISFGAAVITPRWLYLLAGATPAAFGDAVICDETLQEFDPTTIRAGQFVTMTPFPGTVDFIKWEKAQAADPEMVAGIPLTRYWLIPGSVRPKMFTPHPSMSSDEIGMRAQSVWDRFYDLSSIRARSRCISSLKGRVAFVLISKLYRRMYAKTGISTDSARRKKPSNVARRMAKPCRMSFQTKQTPGLEVPQ